MRTASVALRAHQRTRRRLSIDVPKLPSLVRYTDEFTEKRHCFVDFHLDNWKLFGGGNVLYCNFSPFDADVGLKAFIKAAAADALTRRPAGNIHGVIFGLARIEPSDIVCMIEATPRDARRTWDVLCAKLTIQKSFEGLKLLLRFAAERRLGHWTPLYLPFLSASLPYKSNSKHSLVRSGDAFLSVAEESKLVRWIYDQTESVDRLSHRDLTNAGLIICSYQFAMRPKQIGLLRRRDCTIRNASGDNAPSVYLQFHMLKQRAGVGRRRALVRKVKREWASIFAEVYRRGSHEPGESFLLGHVSSSEVGRRLNAQLREILGAARSANHVRHSGAMRLVDAGAGAEELAEFLGHAHTNTGLVYFQTSARQAERVNDALGISETYRHLAKLGKNRFISHAELQALKGDQQIGGAPHGIPIAGIGGCAAGQPSCPYNPVIACYGCHKFLPLRDIRVHQQVLADFRGVVSFFQNASRGEVESSAVLAAEENDYRSDYGN